MPKLLWWVIDRLDRHQERRGRFKCSVRNSKYDFHGAKLVCSRRESQRTVGSGAAECQH